MALTLRKKLILVMFTILGTWTSQAMSRTLQEASMEERHEQWMSQYDRKYSDEKEKELMRHFKIFKENAEFVEKANSERIGIALTS